MTRAKGVKRVKESKGRIRHGQLSEDLLDTYNESDELAMKTEDVNTARDETQGRWELRVLSFI